MWNWIKNNKNVLIVLLLFMLGGPLLLNILFKHSSPIDWLGAEWSVDSALAYYGTMIAAVITVYGVFLTIKYSQENYREDVKNRTLPFIVITMLKTKSNAQLSPYAPKNSTPAEQSYGYQEYKLQDYYCILENGNIFYKTGLTVEQKQLLDNCGFKRVANSEGCSLRSIDDVCIPIEIENVGNGTAIRLRYGLNRKDTPDSERQYLPAISLKTFTPIMLHIFSEDCSKSSPNLGEYVLSFYYDDIYSNKYKQEFDIDIKYDAQKCCPVTHIDMGHIQNHLGGTQ